MEYQNQLEAERELRMMGADQLRRERLNIQNDLKRLQEQIGDLAFNNYRTYADAGRTTQHCTETFTEMNVKLKEISADLPLLSEELKAFNCKAKKLREERDLLTNASDKSNPLWEMLGLPARMDLCIRTGYYEAAYALTNYGMQLQQTNLINNPIIKQIADKLIDSRSFLLEELFNKFAGPLDLAQSIQVVNNVRKIPYLSNTQLRVSVLQYRDMYLDKQILDISTHPEFVLQAIEIYRTCMYDTMVLYLAVFPENEISRRDHTIDPRWEQWPESTPSAVLSDWATRNVHRLLDLIHRADMKSQVDMSAVWSKLMSFASSFGRMSLDFRPLIVNALTKMVETKFRNHVRQVTQKMVNEVKRVDVMIGDVSNLSGARDPNAPPVPPAEISMWDDICIYGNGLVEAFNILRYSLSPILLEPVLSTLRESLRAVFSWLGGYSSSAHFERAVRILGVHLIAFLTQCIHFYFPFSTVSRLFGSTISRKAYEEHCDLNVRRLVHEADGSDKIEEILLPLLDAPKVDSAMVDRLLQEAQRGLAENGTDVAGDEVTDDASSSSLHPAPVFNQRPSIPHETTPPRSGSSTQVDLNGTGSSQPEVASTMDETLRESSAPVEGGVGVSEEQTTTLILTNTLLAAPAADVYVPIPIDVQEKPVFPNTLSTTQSSQSAASALDNTQSMYSDVVGCHATQSSDSVHSEMDPTQSGSTVESPLPMEETQSSSGGVTSVTQNVTSTDHSVDTQLTQNSLETTQTSEGCQSLNVDVTPVSNLDDSTGDDFGYPVEKTIPKDENVLSSPAEEFTTSTQASDITDSRMDVTLDDYSRTDVTPDDYSRTDLTDVTPDDYSRTDVTPADDYKEVDTRSMNATQDSVSNEEFLLNKTQASLSGASGDWFVNQTQVSDISEEPLMNQTQKSLSGEFGDVASTQDSWMTEPQPTQVSHSAKSTEAHAQNSESTQLSVSQESGAQAQTLQSTQMSVSQELSGAQPSESFVSVTQSFVSCEEEPYTQPTESFVDVTQESEVADGEEDGTEWGWGDDKQEEGVAQGDEWGWSVSDQGSTPAAVGVDSAIIEPTSEIDLSSAPTSDGWGWDSSEQQEQVAELEDSSADLHLVDVALEAPKRKKDGKSD